MPNGKQEHRKRGPAPKKFDPARIVETDRGSRLTAGLLWEAAKNTVDEEKRFRPPKEVEHAAKLVRSALRAVERLRAPSGLGASGAPAEWRAFLRERWTEIADAGDELNLAGEEFVESLEKLYGQLNPVSSSGTARRGGPTPSSALDLAASAVLLAGVPPAQAVRELPELHSPEAIRKRAKRANSRRSSE